MTYACPACEFAADARLIKIAAPAKQGSPHYWQFSKAHIGSRYACSFPDSLRL
jgi:hypothetical protein